MDINKVTKSQVESLLMSYQQSPETKRLKDYFAEKSFLEILHVERKENYHSNFLMWVFEDKELYRHSINLLLFLLLKRSRQLGGSYFPDSVSNALLTNSFSIDSVSGELEDSIINDNGRGRCDIRLSIKYHIKDGESKTLYVLIENKVFSDEHKVGDTNFDQTEFYYRHYKREYGEKNCIFVFLNLIDSRLLDSLSESQCQCKKYIQVNYQDLLDDVFSVMLSSSSISTRSRFILNEYIKGLSIQNNYSIMAIEQSLIDLLVSFWDNNSELIKLSIAALAVSQNTDEVSRTDANEMQEKIQQLEAKRDTTHYIFNGKEYKGKSALLYGVLEYLLSKSGKTTSGINNTWSTFLNTCKGNIADFGNDLNWTIKKHYDGSNSSGFNKALSRELEALKKRHGLIYTESEFESVPDMSKGHNYTVRLLNNNSYRCYNQWGWGNIDYLIKFFRESEKLKIDLL